MKTTRTHERRTKLIKRLEYLHDIDEIKGNERNAIIQDASVNALNDVRLSKVEREIIFNNQVILMTLIKNLGSKGALELLAAVGCALRNENGE